MKFPRIALGAATVLAQAVLPSAAAIKVDPVSYKALRPKDALKSKPFAAALPQADVASANTHKTGATSRVERELSLIQPAEDAFTSVDFDNNGARSLHFHVVNIRDGNHADVVRTNRRPTANQLFLSNGDGSFADPIDLEEGSSFGDNNHPNGLVYGDFTGDDMIDIFICRAGHGAKQGLHVRTSEDPPEFELRMLSGLPQTTYLRGCDAADMNEDGNLDIVIANLDNTPDMIWLGNGDGTFSSVDLPQMIGVNVGRWHTQVADLDGDGDLDIVFATDHQANHYIQWNRNPTPPSTNTFSANNFELEALEDTRVTAIRMNIADMDGDGSLDLVFPHTSSTDRGTDILFGDGAGQFPDRVHVDQGPDRWSSQVVVGDFNGDLLPDVYALTRNDQQQVIGDTLLINNGNRTFATYEAGNLYSTKGYVAAGDFNEDGKLDVITTLHTPNGNGIPVRKDKIQLNQGIVPPSVEVATPATSPTAGTGGGTSSSGGDADSAGPWEIQHISLSTDFSNSSANEISSDFFIGKDRESEVLLLDKDCMSNITDIVINTTKVVENQNSTHDLLSVGLSVDKSAIGNSSIYNKTSNEIKLCQVTRLVLPGSKSGGNGALTIAEHLLQIAVAFDLSANFNFTAGLEAGKISNETEEVNAAAAVDAFKCDKSFNPNDDALGPNDQMFTCVRSKDAAFQVQEVERMTISQIGKQQDLEVIAGGVVQIPSISTRDYTAEGAIVGSRIPINLFDFEDGAFLKISGAVTMKLADGTSRRLNVELGSAIRDLQDETKEASYTVDVALQAAEESAIDLSNSAAGVAAAALGGFAIATFFLLL